MRQLGYALDNEENELGVRCIAAAIPDYRGRASYAISLSAPVSRMTDQRVAGCVRRSWLRGTKSRARSAAAAFEEGRA